MRVQGIQHGDRQKDRRTEGERGLRYRVPFTLWVRNPEELNATHYLSRFFYFVMCEKKGGKLHYFFY